MTVEYKMYGGKVVMTYSPKAHAYVVNGTILPSVTKITGIINKPALIGWAVNETIARIGQLWQVNATYSEEQIKAALDDAKGARFRTSGAALNIGSLAHDWIERYIKAKMYKIPMPEEPDYAPVKFAVQSFLDWESEHEIEYLSSERKVLSLEHMYSGTVDLCLMLDSKLVVADLKTSKAIYPEYLLQCAAYAYALTEESSQGYDAIAIIRIPKEENEKVEVVVDNNIGTHFAAFLGCLSVLRWQEAYGNV